MKWLVASDLHGSAYWCRRLLERYTKEQADRLVLLGDLLYHGPRNDLPQDYAPREVIAQLNRVKNSLLCVRGNCDAEVDQMVLEFPMMADYAVLDTDAGRVYITHGHIYGPMHTPPLCPGDILLYGHTHIPACTQQGACLFMNPGSVSLPKENSYHGYMTLQDGLFLWKDMDGVTRSSYQSKSQRPL